MNEKHLTDTTEANAIKTLIGRVNSPEAKRGLEIVDELADLICFHAKCRENGEIMLIPWDIDD